MIHFESHKIEFKKNLTTQIFQHTRFIKYITNNWIFFYVRLIEKINTYKLNINTKKSLSKNKHRHKNLHMSHKKIKNFILSTERSLFFRKYLVKNSLKTWKDSYAYIWIQTKFLKMLIKHVQTYKYNKNLKNVTTYNRNFYINIYKSRM